MNLHKLFFLSFIFFLPFLSQSQNFVDELYLQNGNSVITGMTFDKVGRLFFWEKSGKVWVSKTVNGTPTKSPLPVIDLSNEVRDNWDLGLIGFVLDNDFLTNGYVYLAFPVAPANLGLNEAMIGRVVRYTCPNPTANFPVVDYNSRLVLIGNSITSYGQTREGGIPILYEGHVGCGLAMGTDGSLLVSTGDGSYFSSNDNGNQGYYEEAMLYGVTFHNIGSNRAQVKESHSGKVLRINPNNGQGMPNNPYYSASAPNSPESRLWARGLRNPWKMIHIPNTGDHYGDPGKFLISDVGSNIAEEINLLSNPNDNFGWPHYEGMSYYDNTRPGAYVASNWKKPIISYRNSFQGFRNGQILNAGTSELPSNTTSFENASSVLLGDFNTNLNFPAFLNDCLFFADYGNKNIYYSKLDANQEPLSIHRLITSSKFIFGMAFNPLDGELYYVGSSDAYGGFSEVRKIKFSVNNQAPIAKISLDSTILENGVLAKLSAKYSYDLDPNDVLTFSWNLGNGTTSSGLEPVVMYPQNGNIITTHKIILTVTDQLGLSSKDSIEVSVGNKPPVINSISILDANSLIPITALTASQNYQVILSSNCYDLETPESLSYNWQIFLGHNGHEHLIFSLTGNNVVTSLANLVCELGRESYWLTIKLTVTDANGAVSKKQILLPPICDGIFQEVSFPEIGEKLTSQSAFTLPAFSSSGLPITYYVINGPAIVLGNQLSLSGRPGKVELIGLQHGNATYNQAEPKFSNFVVTRSITDQVITFNPVSNVISNQLVTLSASSNLNLPVAYILLSGPATINGNVLSFTGQSGKVRVAAFNQGSYNTSGAYAEISFIVCPQSLQLNNSSDNLNSITKTYYSNSSILANNVIDGSSRIIYDSKESIILSAGFRVDNNSVFETRLNGCPF